MYIAFQSGRKIEHELEIWNKMGWVEEVGDEFGRICGDLV